MTTGMFIITWFLSGALSSIIFWKYFQGGYVINIKTLVYGFVGTMLGYIWTFWFLILVLFVWIVKIIDSPNWNKVIWQRK